MAPLARPRRTQKKHRAGIKTPAKRRAVRQTVSREVGTITIENGKIVLMIPGKLKSLNQLKSGLARYGDTKAWENRIKKARNDFDDGSVKLPIMSRARLEMSRLVPTRSSFLDQTNLEGSVKGFEDALKRLGYIFNDNHKWIDRPQVNQFLAPDRQYWATAIVTVLE